MLRSKTLCSRISASCFRALSKSGDCRFLGFTQFDFSSDRVPTVTRPAAAARLDSASLPLPENKPADAAPARADRPFRGIALILASTVFLGASDVTAKYLSTSLPSIEIAWIRFPGVRPDHGSGDGAGLAAIRLAYAAAGPATDARRGAVVVVAVFHFRFAVSSHCGSLRHRLRLAAVRHRAVDHFPRRARRPAALACDRGRSDRRS